MIKNEASVTEAAKLRTCSLLKKRQKHETCSFLRRKHEAVRLCCQIKHTRSCFPLCSAPSSSCFHVHSASQIPEDPSETRQALLTESQLAENKQTHGAETP
ncbi:hypothetical protein ILYODFUR_018218 [Ilyodon furcidens]|uniref:Uncharacterized protein n=1 Tax=Ilyodon furcidens TaxID=33524 RepID=A0ABV0SY35_9TELE